VSITCKVQRGTGGALWWLTKESGRLPDCGSSVKSCFDSGVSCMELCNSYIVVRAEHMEGADGGRDVVVAALSLRSFDVVVKCLLPFFLCGWSWNAPFAGAEGQVSVAGTLSLLCGGMFSSGALCKCSVGCGRMCGSCEGMDQGSRLFVNANVFRAEGVVARSTCWWTGVTDAIGPDGLSGESWLRCRCGEH
jgi:hypothetical protein